MRGMRGSIFSWGPWLSIVLMITFLLSCGSEDPVSPEPPEPPEPVDQPALKIGLLIDLSEGGSEHGVLMRRGFEMAIAHVNEVGVLGEPVEGVVADTELNAETAVSEAMDLVEDKGVHAIVGAWASSSTLAIVDEVVADAGIPMISPASSSPMLTTAMDNDFLFRTTLSDHDQGPVLAKITLELGYGNVGMIYRDDVWGRGIADAFENAWEGKLIRVAADPGKTTLVEELRESKGVLEDTQALIVLAFQPQQETIVREALDNGFYDVFIFGPTGRSLDLIRSIGPEHLAGMIGTSPGSAQDTPSAIAWEDGYKSAYGSNPPPFPYVKQTFDATVALALAAQAAGRLEGTPIRDQLRTIGRPPGELVIAEASSIANGLRVLADGGAINYEGAAMPLDWDENGDLATGFVAVWQFTPAGTIEVIRVVPFEH